MESISVTDPIGPAMERVKQILFRPFDVGKWFVIGFCAWLAQLGEGGGGGNFGNQSDHHGDIHHELEQIHSYVSANLYWILPLVIFIVLLIVGLALLVLWLNSRGKFMFLHCVALNRAEVAEPWRRYGKLANSLFWFRFVLGLIGLVVVMPLVVLMILTLIPMFSHGAWRIGGIMLLIGLFMAMLVISLFFFLIRKLTRDFVVPIMYLRGIRCLAAWKEFRQLLGAHFGAFALYLLFQLVIHIIIGIMVFAVVIVTCCIAGCFLMIPYIGSVLLLPFSTFTRAYSLYYLAQYGPKYNVYLPNAATTQ